MFQSMCSPDIYVMLCKFIWLRNRKSTNGNGAGAKIDRSTVKQRGNGRGDQSKQSVTFPVVDFK